MKGIQFSKFGGPDVLGLQTCEMPTPEEGELLLKVLAAGINPIDCKIREGSSFVAKSLSLPSGLGFDVCGEVIESMTDNNAFNVGDVVFGTVGQYDKPQSYAEYCIAKPSQLALKPEGLSEIEAAALSLVGLTAWQAVFSHGKLKKGERVLIHAAAGGVGHLAVQFAVSHGGYVIGTATSKDHGLLKKNGANEIIDYSKVAFETVCDEIDLVIDLVGGETGLKSLDVLSVNGRLVTVPTITRDEILAKAKEKNRHAMGMLMALNSQDLSDIAALVSQKKVSINIAETFPLAKAKEAHEALEARRASGKYVLVI